MAFSRTSPTDPNPPSPLRCPVAAVVAVLAAMAMPEPSTASKDGLPPTKACNQGPFMSWTSQNAQLHWALVLGDAVPLHVQLLLILQGHVHAVEMSLHAGQQLLNELRELHALASQQV